MTFLHLNFSSTKTFLFSLLYRSSILSVKVSSAGLTLGKSQKVFIYNGDTGWNILYTVQGEKQGSRAAIERSV